MKTLRKEKSCGCIIVNDDKVLLVFEANRNFWGFPKGHVNPGETEIETAKREVMEEVGLDVYIDESKRYEMHYTIWDEIDKTTVLFLSTPKNLEIKRQEGEIEKIKWCNFDEALEVLTYDNWKEMYKEVLKDLKNGYVPGNK